MGIPITNLDQFGFIYDRKPYTLPPNAWSDARNIRLVDGSIYPTYGHEAVLGVPLIRPYYLHATMGPAQTPLFAYVGLDKAYATDGTTHTEITRASGDYTGTDADLWQASDFGGISIFNNGVDDPQAWIQRDLSQQLVDLPNWPANTTARVVRTFRRFIFAFDVTEGGTRYPQLAKWSDEADPGQVPVTWDVTDETKNAGAYPLIDTSGEIIDALSMGENFFIYKSDATYLARYIGGTFIFDLPLAFRGFGALAQRCIGEWRKKHIVAHEDNLFMNDGFKFESILDGRTRRWLSARIDSSNAFRSFIVINDSENEAWFCFPENGSTFPNIRLVVNLLTGAGVPCDLPDVAHIEYGKTPILGSSTIDSQTIPIDDMVGYFGQSQNSLTKKRLIGVVPFVNRNLLLHSEAFDNAAWAKTALTVTADVDGTLDKLVPSVANTEHYLDQTITKEAESQNWSLTAVAKASGYSGILLSLYGDTGNFAWARFSLVDGTVTSTLTGLGFSSIEVASELIGTEWHLRLACSTDAHTALHAVVNVGSNGTTMTFAGNGTDGILVGRIQLRQGPVGDYQITGAVAADSAVYLFDVGYDFDGVPFTAYCERTGMAVSGQNRDGSLREDPMMNKLFQTLWPKVEMLNGTSVGVRAGGQRLPDGSVEFIALYPFDPTVEQFVPVDVECKYEAVRFESSNREFWRLTEYDIEIANLGRH